ncbi:MAG: CBS domain-containing protein [Clostridia bacterium]|nr:CBS domain-containing protein [Clostridia bacterium]
MTKAVKTKSNSERFIIAYNSIDYSLRTIYGFKRSISYADLIRKTVPLNSVVRKYEDDLIDYGRLRNSIVHKTNPNYVIAEPHDEVVDEFEKIAKLIATPPTAFNKVCNKEVVICGEHTTVKDVLEIMARTGYHNIPVYMNDVLQGVAISSKLIEVIGRKLIEGQDISTYLANTKVLDVITKDDESNYYRVADKNMTIEKALNYFYINRKLSLIIITEKGTYNEKPIGIITTADILDMNAVLENY